MDQQSGDGSMDFENAFNGASQNAIGQGARVNIGTDEAAGMNAGSGNRQPAPGNISITNAFNHASRNAVGTGAQVNVHTGAPDFRAIPDTTDPTPIWTAGPVDQPISIRAGARKIIISYSHKDRQWLNRLRTHLAFLEQQGLIDLWDDTQIAAGAHWRQAITGALSNANFALLLISADFLASNFITREELPQILQHLSQGQLRILPLILSPCLFEESLLGNYQPFNPAQPLALLSFAEQENVLVRVAREILKAVQ